MTAIEFVRTLDRSEPGWTDDLGTLVEAMEEYAEIKVQEYRDRMREKVGSVLYDKNNAHAENYSSAHKKRSCHVEAKLL